MKLDPQFMLAFCSYFDADILEIDDPDALVENPERIKESAAGCAASLNLRKNLDLLRLIQDLRWLREQRPRNEILEIADATGIDWLEDDYMRLFLLIISEITNNLEIFEKQRSEASL